MSSWVTPLRWWSQPKWLKNQFTNRHPLYLISSIQKLVWPKQLLYSAACYRNIHLSVSDEQDMDLNWDVDSVNNPKAIHYWSGCRAKWLKKPLWHHFAISKHNGFSWMCTFHHTNPCAHAQTHRHNDDRWGLSLYGISGCSNSKIKQLANRESNGESTDFRVD